MGVKRIKKMVDVMRKFEKAITPKRTRNAFQECMHKAGGYKKGKPGEGLSARDREYNRQIFKQNLEKCKTSPAVLQSKKARLARMQEKLGI